MTDDTTATAERGTMFLPARAIPPPRCVSPEARAAFIQLVENFPVQQPYPPLTDKAAWKAHIAAHDAMLLEHFRQLNPIASATSERAMIGGVPVFVAQPEHVPPQNRDKALIWFHGGGLVMMSGECTRVLALREAATYCCRVYAVDYRVPPDHPFPAALEDCCDVYAELLDRYAPAQIVFSGISGGGNLAAAVPLRLRDLGIPLPAAIGLFTPELDLTESGDSIVTNAGIDPVLVGSLSELVAVYAGDHRRDDPYMSPVLGDFSKGFSPTFLQAGTRDRLLSDTVRFHRALRTAGILAELNVWEGMPHGSFTASFGTGPEDHAIADAFKEFLARVAGWAPPAR